MMTATWENRVAMMFSRYNLSYNSFSTGRGRLKKKYIFSWAWPSQSTAEKQIGLCGHGKEENPLQLASFILIFLFFNGEMLSFRLFLTCRKYPPPEKKEKRKMATLRSISDGKCYGVILFSSLLWGTLKAKLSESRISRALLSIFKWYQYIYRFSRYYGRLSSK